MYFFFYFLQILLENDTPVLLRIFGMYLSQLMRLWYLSHRRPAKAKVSQSIRCSHTWSMEVDKGSEQKSDI